MDDERELGYLLAVAAAAVWTPRPLVAMLQSFGSASALVAYAKNPLAASAAPCEHVSAQALARIALVDDRTAQAALAAARTNDQLVITSSAAAYPARLLHLCDPPPVLYVRGNPDALHGRAIAIVGSRAATPYGRSMTKAIVNGFAAYGARIISGLARGIDAAAHRAATAAGLPTVAVIGSGLSALYPDYHSQLAEEIAACGGAVISEFPPTMAARQHHFPMRNRLVAALGDATVVVEAGAKSGALITARLAGELGRCVFAVPGDVGRTTSEGTNALIKDGVALATGAEDIAAVLAWEPQMPESAHGLGRAGSHDSAVLAALACGAADVDGVCRHTGLDAATVNAQLTMLEMQGLVEHHPGGLYVVASKSSSKP
jgi:DNA processing protein